MKPRLYRTAKYSSKYTKTPYRLAMERLAFNGGYQCESKLRSSLCHLRRMRDRNLRGMVAAAAALCVRFFARSYAASPFSRAFTSLGLVESSNFQPGMELIRCTDCGPCATRVRRREFLNAWNSSRVSAPSRFHRVPCRVGRRKMARAWPHAIGTKLIACGRPPWACV